ncbi:MAG: hypothetical protein AAFY71_24400 [Bacteroidota bacterium]
MDNASLTSSSNQFKDFQLTGVQISSILLTGLILLYTAGISFHFYHNLFVPTFPTQSIYLGWAVTTAIAIAIFAFMQAMASMVHQVAQKGIRVLKGKVIFTIALFLTLGILVTLDFYANINGSRILVQEGIEQESNSQVVKADTTTAQDIATKEAQLAKLISCEIKGYCWRGYLTEAGIAFQHQLSTELIALREQKSKQLEKRERQEERLAQKIETEITNQTQAHTTLIWIVYPLAFLLCLVSHGCKQLRLQPNHESDTRLEKAEALVVEDRETVFLNKWREAVDLILQGYTNKQVISLYTGPEGKIGGTTIQKLKTVLRAKGKLPTLT